MYYKIFIKIVFLMVLMVNIVPVSYSACSYQSGQLDAVKLLDDCKPAWISDSTTWDGAGIGWLKWKAYVMGDALIWLGSLLSVGAIVIGWFLYASSMGSDEKVKKWKNAVIYGLIGLLVMMFSFPVVNAIIEFIYTANN